MKAILITVTLIMGSFGAIVQSSNNTERNTHEEAEPVSFRDDVFPLLKEHCLPCHLREKRNMSRLFLDDYESLMKGGFNGPPVKPGNAEESLLIKKLRPNPPFGQRMPMRSFRYLHDDEIATIERWINEGALDN